MVPVCNYDLLMDKARQASTIFEEYVNRGEMQKGKRTGFVKEVMDGAEKTRKDFEKLVAGQVDKTIGKLNLASREDVKRLEKKLDQLLKKGR